MFHALSRFGRRRTLQTGAVLAVVLGLLAWWLQPQGDEGDPSGSLTFSTGVPSGVYQRYGERLEVALAKDIPEVSIRLRTSEGSQQNLARVATGEADFTIATADAVATYLRDGRPGAQRLRGCVRLYDDYVQLVVPRDSDVRTVADLRGKRVGVGQEGSGVRLVADRLLAAAGLDPADDVTPVPVGIDTMPVRLTQGRPTRSSGRAGCRPRPCRSCRSASTSGWCRWRPSWSRSCRRRPVPLASTGRP